MKKYIFTLVLLMSLITPCFAKDVVIFAGQSNALLLDTPAFQAKYLALTGQPVDVYNCAVGSTYIMQHALDFVTPSLGAPTAECRQIMQREVGLGNTIKGVIFWQGESDTFKTAVRPAAFRGSYSTDWLRNFQTVQQIFRNAINKPALKFVVIRLPKILPGCMISSIEPISYQYIREFQKALPFIQNDTAILANDDEVYTCGDVHLTGQPGAYTRITENAASTLVNSFSS
jgi:hypothetical protein